MTDVEDPTCLLCDIIYKISIPMKMISCVLCDLNALFDGNVGVKISKGACFLEKEFFYRASIIYAVQNDGFIRTYIDLTDIH